MSSSRIEIVRSAYIETLNNCSDTEFKNYNGWIQTITPSKKERWFNRVIFSKSDQFEISNMVDKTLAKYQENQSDCEWLLWPDTEPANMDKVLKEYGFKSAEVSEGMVIETQKHEQIIVPQSLEVTKVLFDEIDQYVETMIAGWESREIDKTNTVERMKRDYNNGDFFWVKHDGEPIATGATQYVSMSGYLSGSSVIPSFRGKGVYRLLVQIRLQEMEKKGVKVASTIALVGTSAPVLIKMGFESPITIRYYSRINS